MATQYTDILKLALPTTGELDGTWGDVVNNNITSMVEEAIAGLSTINTWSANSHTLTTANGTTSESRAAMLILTDSGGALTGAGEVICPAETKIYLVYNNTGETITVKTSAGTGADILDGVTLFVYCDGTNVEKANTDTTLLLLNYPVGTNNVGVGSSVFSSITSASSSTGVGSSALTSLTSGANNTAVGASSLTAITSGTRAAAFGKDSMLSATTGNFNAAFGTSAGESITTGSNNSAFGDDALSNVSTTGFNTAVGVSAGGSITSGSNNTAIGGDSMAFFGAAITGSNLTCLGYDSQPSAAGATNEVTLGNSSVATLRCNTTTISSLSDQRDKKDIIDSPYGLNIIEKVKPRQFVWDSRRGNIKDGTVEIGFVAQELQEVGDNEILQLVMDENPEFLEAKPGSLIPILVKAVQELSEKVKDLESKL